LVAKAKELSKKKKKNLKNKNKETMRLASKLIFWTSVLAEFCNALSLGAKLKNDGPSCPASGLSCTKASIDSCCVPNHGLLVLAGNGRCIISNRYSQLIQSIVQWLPGYCKGNKGTDSCTHDILDRLPTNEWTVRMLSLSLE
jgi:hypothetical protein